MSNAFPSDLVMCRLLLLPLLGLEKKEVQYLDEGEHVKRGSIILRSTGSIRLYCIQYEVGAAAVLSRGKGKPFPLSWATRQQTQWSTWMYATSAARVGSEPCLQLDVHPLPRSPSPCPGMPPAFFSPFPFEL